MKSATAKMKANITVARADDDPIELRLSPKATL